ncbi:MAG: hypothetical protein LBL66_02370 [Clostridiales bacterium]|jgi:hypothetical protein|nr:hypothetical protein [Clostridiales bacterium]
MFINDVDCPRSVAEAYGTMFTLRGEPSKRVARKVDSLCKEKLARKDDVCARCQENAKANREACRNALNQEDLFNGER